MAGRRGRAQAGEALQLGWLPAQPRAAPQGCPHLAVGQLVRGGGHVRVFFGVKRAVAHAAQQGRAGQRAARA